MWCWQNGGVVENGCKTHERTLEVLAECFISGDLF